MKNSQMEKPIVHLVCNAHLDPVWQWEWEEGACEALSTFRTAADLCEESESFVFNHNEVILYKWIEQYEPELFNRIRSHGWMVSPARLQYAVRRRTRSPDFVRKEILP